MLNLDPWMLASLAIVILNGAMALLYIGMLRAERRRLRSEKIKRDLMTIGENAEASVGLLRRQYKVNPEVYQWER